MLTVQQDESWTQAVYEELRLFVAVPWTLRGSTSMCNCALTTAFHRVRGLHVWPLFSGPCHGGVSVLWHSPSLGLHASVKHIVTQPKPGSSFWRQMRCDTAQTLVFVLVSNALWHSPSLGVLAGVKCTATQPEPRQQRPTSKTTCCPALLFSLTHP